jgi:hypothetical protein
MNPAWRRVFFAVQNDPAIVFSNPESVVFDE